MSLATHQPFKALYVLAALGFELTRLPLISVQYLSKGQRPSPTWTLRQAISVHLLYSLLHLIGRIRLVTPLPLTPGTEGERFTLLQPAKDDMYQGPLRGNSNIKPSTIGATWYDTPLTAKSDKSNVTVILHLHGGGFVLGNGRTEAFGHMARKLLRHTRATHYLCPQYRLSTLPASASSNAFPAAFQDSLTSYLYLVNDLNISPKNIILSGDSAGGNLAIVLLRYIAEYGADLGIPNPSACLLWSPWINPAHTSTSYVYDNPHYATDYLSPPFTEWGCAAYAGLMGLKNLNQPYISQKNRPFSTNVPLWVNTGGAELLYFDNVEWCEDMKKQGNRIEQDIDRHMPHDILPVAHQLGFEKEAADCAKRAGEWLENIAK